MSWIATGVSVVGGVMGMMGGSKAPERAAKDAAARAAIAQDQARRQSLQVLDPYMDTGRNASRMLAEEMGIADPTGYAPRPELQDFVDQVRNEHFNKYGKDYNRNSEMAGEAMKAKQRFDVAMKAWEAGAEKYKAENPGSEGSGNLLKNFTNEDFVKEPGYEFRLGEGEKAANRAASAGGRYDSGATLKALVNWNQDFASNEFGNAFNRDAANKARKFSFLSNSAGQGLQAAGVGVGANTNAANVNSQVQQNLGSNLASMYQQNDENQSNSLQSALTNGLYGYLRNKSVITPTVPSSGGNVSTGINLAGWGK
jgi:hypothetical protein